MARFHPYSIHHLQYSGIEKISLPAGNHYLVMWSGKIPVGHYWLESGKAPVSLADHRGTLEAMVRPVLEKIKASWGGRGEMAGEGEGSGINGEIAGGSEMAGNGNGGLSVVICTRNRPVDLERCVKILLDSSDKDFELIVVDNAPDDDRTERVVGKFSSVRYVREERKGLDIARNTGARAASGGIIAYTDDDVVVDKDWISHMKTCFTDPQVMAVTGIVLPAQLRTRSQYIFERYWSFNKGYLPKIFDHRYFLDHLRWGAPVWDIGAGANMAFRREAFELAGFFDERLDVGAAGCSGDSEFWYRILAEGWNCLYLPHIVVYHNHRESDTALRNQLFHYMRGHVSALLVQYERYGHTGNLRRLGRGLPQYFLTRIGQWLLRRNRQAKENSRYLFTEIRGCFSGWRFYRSVRGPIEENLKIAIAARGRNGRSGWEGLKARAAAKAKEFLSAQMGVGAPGAPPGVVKKGEGRLAQDARGQLPIPARLLEDAVLTEDTLVSVIIPCYNHAHYLDAAIATVLDQTYKRAEIIVVDDGSTDGTELACSKYDKGKVRYVRVERVGVSAARNIGVRVSRGDFVVFLDADDLLYPNAIELNLFYFTVYKKAAYVSGGHDRIDREGRFLQSSEAVIKAGDNYWSLLQGNYIAMEGAVMYRREVFFRWHFDTSVSACEDYDLNLQIARYLPVFGHAAKVAAYRIHDGNMSRNKKMMAESALYVLKRQEKLLQNGEEMKAYRTGIENWQKYYFKDAETQANKV